MAPGDKDWCFFHPKPITTFDIGTSRAPGGEYGREHFLESIGHHVAHVPGWKPEWILSPSSSSQVLVQTISIKCLNTYKIELSGSVWLWCVLLINVLNWYQPDQITQYSNLRTLGLSAASKV